MKTKEIQARFDRGYTMAIYGTRENIHEQMTNDIKELLKAINYSRCCKSDSEQLAEHKCKFYVSADWTYLKCECGKIIKPSEG